MELQFHKSVCTFLNPIISAVQNQEQAQEIRLTDDMPDIANVIAAWGQPILRSKEWEADRVNASGGMSVRILYQTENDAELRISETWIPFSFQWNLSEDAPTGTMLVSLRTRFVNVRSVSPRRMVVRAGLSALLEGFADGEADMYKADHIPSDIKILTERYPVRLYRETGEKTYYVEDHVSIVNDGELVLCAWYCSPQITEKKVMGNKIAFRGNVNLHAVFLRRGSEIVMSDYPMTFSQFAELKQAYGSDGEVTIRPCVTDAEVEMAEDGLRVRIGLSAQYAVSTQEVLEIAADAYSISNQLQLTYEETEIPAQLDVRREIIPIELEVPGEAETPLEMIVTSDFPSWHEETGLIASGNMDVVYTAQNGSVRAAIGRWEGSCALEGSADNCIIAIPELPTVPRTVSDRGIVRVTFEQPVEVLTLSGSKIRQLTGIEGGAEKQRDPGRPSLILRRADTSTLWEIAKQTGSSAEAIRNFNSIESEPQAGQMLLIPIL